MACIYCYSGTGNSLYAAKRIASGINADVLSMTNAGATCDADVIGFVFPTYFWGLPKTVECFVKELIVTKKNPYIFAVTTYGSVIHGVIGVLENLLKKKGLNIAYGCGLKSVENYTPGYKINDTPGLRNKNDENLKKITDDIAKRTPKKYSHSTIVNKLVMSFSPAKNGDCDKLFTVSDACVGCGHCRDICPTANIDIKNGKPVFLHHCEHCISCVHICKSEALDWKGGAAKHGRYLNRNINAEELIAFSGRNGRHIENNDSIKK